jgi:hypothetical protein
VLRQRDLLWDYEEWEMRRHDFSLPVDEFEAFLGRPGAARTVALSCLHVEGEP